MEPFNNIPKLYHAPNTKNPRHSTLINPAMHVTPEIFTARTYNFTKSARWILSTISEMILIAFAISKFHRELCN